MRVQTSITWVCAGLVIAGLSLSVGLDFKQAPSVETLSYLSSQALRESVGGVYCAPKTGPPKAVS